ncbi:MAG TPA: Yip1 family protein [Thermoanaerobaculia bacterium]|nr:Yip1 family protein [Thermoanaerobaculia bacterium]
MTDGVELAAPAPQEPKQSSFSRIAGVFFAPSETFASIVRRPDFVVPLVIIMVVSLLTGILIAEKVDFKVLIRDQIESSPNASRIPADIKEKQISIGAGMAKALTFFAPITSVVGLVIFAAVFFAAFKILGGEGDFLQAFSITAYAWMPNMIRSILTLIPVMTKKSLTMFMLQNPIASNPGYFIDPKLHPIAAAFLGSFDVFTIWTLVLLIIGFAAMSRFSKTKAAVIMLSLWAIKILFSVGMGALAVLRMRAQ